MPPASQQPDVRENRAAQAPIILEGMIAYSASFSSVLAARGAATGQLGCSGLAGPVPATSFLATRLIICSPVVCPATDHSANDLVVKVPAGMPLHAGGRDLDTTCSPGQPSGRRPLRSGIRLQRRTASPGSQSARPKLYPDAAPAMFRTRLTDPSLAQHGSRTFTTPAHRRRNGEPARSTELSITVGTGPGRN